MTSVHPTAILDQGATIGSRTSVWDNVHLRERARVGNDCIVGEKSHLGPGVSVGDRVKINAFVYVCSGVTIEDGVMISAGTIFTNDRYPRATTPDLAALLPSDLPLSAGPTVVCEGATIGAGTVVGAGIRIGRFAMVGMGSVVTRSVPDFHLSVGQPSRSLGCVCRCGRPLLRFAEPPASSGGPAVCSACGRRYALDHLRVTEVTDEARQAQ